MADNRRYFGGPGVLSLGGKIFRSVQHPDFCVKADELPKLDDGLKARLKKKGQYVEYQTPVQVLDAATRLSVENNELLETLDSFKEVNDQLTAEVATLKESEFNAVAELEGATKALNEITKERDLLISERDALKAGLDELQKSKSTKKDKKS